MCSNISVILNSREAGIAAWRAADTPLTPVAQHLFMLC
jgi:hypothetical protein